MSKKFPHVGQNLAIWTSQSNSSVDAIAIRESIQSLFDEYKDADIGEHRGKFLTEFLFQLFGIFRFNQDLSNAW
jgi:hypothetical protein